MFKRVFAKMVLSSFVLVSGMFLWSNGGSSSAYAQVSSETGYMCLPGGPNYPDCLGSDKDKKKPAEVDFQ